MTKRSRGLLALVLASALCGAVIGSGWPAAAEEVVQQLTFSAAEDTFVSSSAPSTVYGKLRTAEVDGSPVKQTFLKFSVTGIAGRTITSVRLRATQTDSSPVGGAVHRISSTSWSQDATTWSTRPAIDGPLLASFGAVAAGVYEVELGAGAISGDGVVSLALQSTNSDAAVWSTREGGAPPALLVDVVSDAPPPPAEEVDGLSVMSSDGSSDPTYYAGNHRLARTKAGRLLAVHGRHAQGVQLTWRDPGGEWRRETTGAVSVGDVLVGTKTGDWPASIVVGSTAAGVEHAWVVWSGTGSNTTAHPVQARHLSALDNPSGPTVGPLVMIAAAGLGMSRPDIALRSTASGGLTAAVTWVRRTSDTASDVVAAWLVDATSDAPVVTAPTVLEPADDQRKAATIEPVNGGVRIVVRGTAGRLRVHDHQPTSPPEGWTSGPYGPVIDSKAKPTAAVVGSELLVAYESATTSHRIAVRRIAANLTVSSIQLDLPGLADPAIATGDGRAWVVAVRVADGFVVSRERVSGVWTTTDRVEIGAEGGGGHRWPNLLRSVDGRLRFVVRATGTTSNASISRVEAYQRTT